MKSRFIICTLLLFGMGCHVKAHKKNATPMAKIETTKVVGIHFNV